MAGARLTTAAAAARVLDLLEGSGIDVWVEGGWGIDALVGRQTRDHEDLDVMVDRAHTDTVATLLSGAGFRRMVDWMPTRYLMVDDAGAAVDVHPVRFDAAGDGWLTLAEGEEIRIPAAGMAGSGAIAGRPVRCFTAQQQWQAHLGYEPLRERDRHDIALLAALVDRPSLRTHCRSEPEERPA